jgi:predicted dehydrogenase
MVAAAEKAATGGVKSMVAFNYRRVPALELARRLVASGRIGDVRHVRAVYLQDWIVDPSFPMVWRLDAGEAGSGALGDIGSHIVDLAQHLLASRITEVAGLTETFIKERPDASGGKGAVTVDDAALFVARFGNGTVGTFEATRFATGRKNGLRIELNGSKGSLAFDLERLNELEVYEADAAGDASGFRRVLVTEADHPWVGAWWPPGHVLGWEHTFVHQTRDLLTAIGTGDDPAPSFADGLYVQRVLAAVVAAAGARAWTQV